MSNKQYFRGNDTSYTKHYGVFSGGGYVFDEILRSVFDESILLVLSNKQYLRG